MAFLQANITCDNTTFVNGAVVGRGMYSRFLLYGNICRTTFGWLSCLALFAFKLLVDQGLCIGSRFPFFIQHQLTISWFIQLKQVEEGSGKPPPPVLVLHSHYGGCVGDLPSYDAFTLGGPYSVRGYNMSHLGAARNILELGAEIRIPVRNTHVYTLQSMAAEYATDHNTGTGSLFFRFGERY